MTDWQWYASRDEEQFTVGPENSREAIIELATNDFDGDPFFIVEATKGTPILDIFDGANLLDMLNEQNAERSDPDGDGMFEDVPVTQVNILAERLNAIVREWAKEFKINPHVWAFDKTRNGEEITPQPRHNIYQIGSKDPAAPDDIKDRNGTVVLGLCKDCGRAEVELSEPCTPAESKP